LKIKSKNGDTLDLTKLRDLLSSSPDRYRSEIMLLDALEATLSVGCDCNTVFEASYVGGYKTALDDVRQAAGVVEEDA
jgi:hypothetical protein